VVVLVWGLVVGVGFFFGVGCFLGFGWFLGLGGELPAETALSALSPLVQIQAGVASRPPFFCVHAVGGGADAYRELAAHLDPAQPFYALQSPGLQGEQPVLTGIKEMAAIYLKEIRKVQPAGPYYLGGWSMGGMVAFEIAQQLLAQGEAVGCLVLLDTALHNNRLRYDPATSSAKLLTSYAAHREGIFLSYAELIQFEPQEQLDYVDRQLQSGGLQSRLGRADNHLLRHIMNVMITNTRALFEYQPQLYPRDLVLLKASEEMDLPEDDNPLLIEQDYAWDKLCQGKLEVIAVPGDHESLMQEPHVRVVAGHLQRLLDHAQLKHSNEVNLI
jgi:thioesterase domain-containing protein